MRVLLDLENPSVVVRQTDPDLNEVNDLIADLERNLAGIPVLRPAPMETLGERDSEFAAVGGEGIYNAGRSR